MSTFVTIPGGWFDMGSMDGHDDEKPVHRVWVDTFEMAVCPVTRREYAAFLKKADYAIPREWNNQAFSAPDQPVVGVSWNDAVVYCRWLSGEGAAVRLPTETEWERAARGKRDAQTFPWGHEIPAWIPNAGKGPLDAPWSVTLGDRNDFGLFGITANIHEWCADWHSKTFYTCSPERNPTGPKTGVRRVSRGGSWRHAVTISRCSARSKLDPTFRYTDYGFRLAR